LLYRDAIATLTDINPNYVDDIANILDELINVKVARSHLVGFSHDMNEFFVIEVNAYGTLNYVYSF